MTSKTRTHNQLPTSSPRIPIGAIIECELRRQERSVLWLSRKIHCDRRNIYDIFKRDSIDTELLLALCRALGVDFFHVYSNQLYNADNQDFTPPTFSLIQRIRNDIRSQNDCTTTERSCDDILHTYEKFFTTVLFKFYLSYLIILPTDNKSQNI